MDMLWECKDCTCTGKHRMMLTKIPKTLAGLEQLKFIFDFWINYSTWDHNILYFYDTDDSWFRKFVARNIIFIFGSLSSASPQSDFLNAARSMKPIARPIIIVLISVLGHFFLHFLWFLCLSRVTCRFTRFLNSFSPSASNVYWWRHSLMETAGMSLF